MHFQKIGTNKNMVEYRIVDTQPDDLLKIIERIKGKFIDYKRIMKVAVTVTGTLILNIDTESIHMIEKDENIFVPILDFSTIDDKLKISDEDRKLFEL